MSFRGTFLPHELEWIQGRTDLLMDRKLAGLGEGKGESDRSLEQRISDTRIGVEAEAGFSKIVGLPLELSSDPDNWSELGDVAGFEVRGSRWDNPHIIIFPNDPNGRQAIVLTVRDDSFRACGWCLIGDGKNERTRRIAENRCRANSPRQWWVPPYDQRPMLELLQGSLL